MECINPSQLQTIPFASRAETMLAVFGSKDESPTSTTRKQKLLNPKGVTRGQSFNRNNNKLNMIGHSASNLSGGGKDASDYKLKTRSGLTADTGFTADTEDASSFLNGEEISLEIKPILSNDPFPELDDDTIFSDVWNTKNFDEGDTECDIMKQKTFVEEGFNSDDTATDGSFDEDIEGEYNSLFSPTDPTEEDDQETYTTLDYIDAPPSPTTRLVESFSSMFNCDAVNSSFVSDGNNTSNMSNTSRRNPNIDLSFEEKAQNTAEAMKSVYGEGSVAVRELFGELRADWARFSKKKIHEFKFHLANRKKKKQHSNEQQKQGFV